jgi:hypothetical protein
MKTISTMKFNAMGVIAPEAGTIIDTKSAVTIAQLENMGFVEALEPKQAKKAESKKAKAK